MAWRGVLSEYRKFMPLEEDEETISLNEGATPLVPAERLGPEFEGLSLFFKVEGCNPTGSFKDRGMALAVTKAKARGAKAVLCASTGNTSAAAAAYAARAGLKAFVVLPSGKVAAGKLAQALIYGARVIPVEGNFDEALAIVRELVAEHPEIELVNSINPYRIPGQRSAAYEICDDLGGAPDYLAIPVGNGGNISAYWQGFQRYHEAGLSEKTPVMIGCQAEGASPLVQGAPIERPETRATAIRIGNPVNWETAAAAVEESGGEFLPVTEDEVAATTMELAERQGLFVEPASAASLAGLRKLAERGELSNTGATAVCVLTGNGLKDPDFARESVQLPDKVEASLPAVETLVLEELS